MGESHTVGELLEILKRLPQDATWEGSYDGEIGIIAAESGALIYTIWPYDYGQGHLRDSFYEPVT